MQSDKIIYWIATGLMLAIFTFSAGMYILNYESSCGFFTNLGFPTWIVAPLAAAKILGIIAILTKKSQMLKEWAYAGFFFDAVLAASAHIMAGDGGQGMSIAAIALVIVSRFYDGKVFGNA